MWPLLRFAVMPSRQPADLASKKKWDRFTASKQPADLSLKKQWDRFSAGAQPADLAFEDGL